MDHHHHAPAVAPERFSGLAKAAFWTGVLSLFLTLITRFAPIGYSLALLTIPLAIAGVVQARTGPGERTARIAMPGVLCALMAIVIWLLARDNWPHVVLGDDNWPNFIRGK